MERVDRDRDRAAGGSRRRSWVPTLGLQDVPRSARPLLVGSAFQTLATAGFSTYVGVWAVQELDAPGAWLGLALGLRAGAGVVTGYVGGALSDRVDRRRIVMASWLAQTLCIAAFVLVERSVLWGLVLIVAFGPLGPPGRAAAAAYVADVADAGEQRARVYASQRSLQALGQVLGPSIGALLVIGDAWDRMYLGFAGVSAVAVLLALSMTTRAQHRTTSSGPSTADADEDSPWTDSVFVVLLVVVTMITMVMAATDRFLPIAAVAEYGVDAAQWGLIAALNPVMVIGLQSMITRRAERWRTTSVLWASAVLVGAPFLLLVRGDGLAIVVVVVLLSTLGEMLWMPLSQGLGADLAPAGRRGAYLGAYDGARSLAFALGPLLALWLADSVGYAPVWVLLAALALVSAASGVGAVRRADARRRDAAER